MTLTADGKTTKDPTLVERWLDDQREWQRTAMAYLDSMVKNEDFLVHLGNAMRGSLLAGKPYPTAAPGAQPAAEETPADDRLDRVLFALHQIQGQLTDLRTALDDLRRSGKGSPSVMPATRPNAKAAKRTKRTKRPAPVVARKARAGKSRSRG